MHSPNGQASGEEPASLQLSLTELFELLASEPRLQILVAVLLTGRCTAAELAGRLRLSPNTVRRHLNVLTSSKLVLAAGDGRSMKYNAARALRLTRRNQRLIVSFDVEGAPGVSIEIPEGQIPEP